MAWANRSRAPARTYRSRLNGSASDLHARILGASPTAVQPLARAKHKAASITQALDDEFEELGVPTPSKLPRRRISKKASKPKPKAAGKPKQRAQRQPLAEVPQTATPGEAPPPSPPSDLAPPPVVPTEVLADKRASLESVTSVASAASALSMLSFSSVGALVTEEDDVVGDLPPLAPPLPPPAATSTSTAAAGAGAAAAPSLKRVAQRSRLSMVRGVPLPGLARPRQSTAARQRTSLAAHAAAPTLSSAALRRVSVGMAAFRPPAPSGGGRRGTVSGVPLPPGAVRLPGLAPGAPHPAPSRRMSLVGSANFTAPARSAPAEQGPASPVATLPTAPASQAPAAVQQDATHGDSDAALSLVLSSVLEWLPDAMLLHTAPAVSREWRRLATSAFSWRAAGVQEAEEGEARATAVLDAEGQEVRLVMDSALLAPWAGYQRAFPWAAFLAEGGFKRVFKVFNAARGVLEAVSLMDMAGVVASGQAGMVRAEVLTGCMVSQLATTHVTPGFVQTLQVLPVAHPPPAAVWGCPDAKSPMGPFPGATALPPPAPAQGKRRRGRPRKAAPAFPPQPTTPGAWQLVRMELCAGGDVEEHLAAVEAAVQAAYEADAQAAAHLDAHAIAQATFQVLQALEAAAQRAAMRHYDMKLLNVLLKPVSDVTTDAGSQAPRAVLRFSAPGASCVQACLGPAHSPCQLEAFLPKLVDFGTADTSVDSMGEPISLAQFTTFENAAPEMLVDGDAARQGHALDIWATGLCLLHLLTGSKPYEEVLEEVRCPPSLAAALHRVWQCGCLSALVRGAGKGRKVAPLAGEQHAPAEALLAAVEFDDEGVLPHTLWRYAVLLGLPPARGAGEGPVMALLRLALGDTSARDLPEVQAAVRKGRGRRAAPKKGDPVRALFPEADNCAGQYRRDCAQYSLQSGEHPLLVRARARMEALPGLEALLLGMLAWCPSERWSYRQCMDCDAFSWMREHSEARAAAPAPPTMQPMAFATLQQAAKKGDVLLQEFRALKWD